MLVKVELIIEGKTKEVKYITYAQSLKDYLFYSNFPEQYEVIIKEDHFLVKVRNLSKEKSNIIYIYYLTDYRKFEEV